jgi:hypothetical protein
MQAKPIKSASSFVILLLISLFVAGTVLEWAKSGWSDRAWLGDGPPAIYFFLNLL